MKDPTVIVGKSKKAGMDNKGEIGMKIEKKDNQNQDKQNQ
jgi:hypothetical protein